MYLVTFSVETRMAGRHSDELSFKQLKKEYIIYAQKINSKHVVITGSIVFEEKRGVLSRINTI